MKLARQRLTKLLTVITLGSFLIAQVTIARPALADPAAQPTSYEEVGAHLDYWANRYNIPPVVLKAVAWMETGWRQYNSNGDPLIGGDGIGLGIMQISHYDPNNQAEIDKLKYDIDYNIEAGCQALNQKWRAYPKVGNGDRNVIENWYFAIWGYNGWSSVNNPNNPNGKGNGAYQDVVFGLMGQKYNRTITYAPGATKIPRQTLPASGLPSLEGQWETPTNFHQGDLKLDVANLTTSGGWNGDATGDYWYNYSPWSSYYALGFYVTAYNGAAEADKPSLEAKILAADRNLLVTADDLLVNNNGSEVLVRRAGKYYWTVLQGPKLDQAVYDQAWRGLGKANVKAAQMSLGSQYDEVLGTAAQELPLGTNSEMALGNWMTDALKARVPEADLALLNPGAITGSLNQGEVTRGEIYELVPYDYKLVTMELTGADILALLEIGADQEKLLQVSGLKYTWDPAQPVNKRIQSALLADGSPLEAGKVYKVVTTDALARGQEGFTRFTNGQNTTNIYLLLRDTLLANLVGSPTLSGTLDGRIKVATAPPPTVKKYVEITASVLNLRTGPSSQYGVAVTLPRGTKLELISSANGWTKVVYNGKPYYVAAEYVKALATAAPAPGNTVPAPAPAPANSTIKYAQTTAGYLNLRTGPGSGYPVAGNLVKGTKVELVSSANGWAKIKYQGKVYYVSAQYVKALSPASAPVASSTGSAAQPSQTTVKYVVTTANYLNLRTGPGAGYQVAGNLVKGTKVELVSTINGWAKIKYQGKSYYVAAEYVK